MASIGATGTSIANLAGNLASESTLNQALVELQDILLELGSKVNDGGTIHLGASDLSALEAITATVVGMPSDYPDAGTHTKLDALNATVDGVEALLTSILGEAGDTNTLLDTAIGTNSLDDLYTKLEAIRVLLAGTITVSGPLTDAQLRASAVPISDNGGSLTVDGTVAVSGAVPVTDNGGSLTVDGSVSVSNFPATQPVSIAATVNTSDATAATKLDTLHADVDGLETAVAATNTKLDTANTTLTAVAGYVDGVEALITSTNTKLDTVHADVDGLETLVTATNTKLDSVNTHLTTIEGYEDGVETKLDTLHTDNGTATTTPPTSGTGIIGWLRGVYDKVEAVRALLASSITISGTVTTSPPSNASTDVTRLAGTAIAVSSGNKDAGTQRVTLATDQVQLTNALKVDGSTGVQGATPTLSRVATSTVSATLVSANASRKEVIIVNESVAVLFVKFGTTATSTSYTYQVPAGGTIIEDVYTGRIDAILAAGAASSNSQVTEVA